MDIIELLWNAHQQNRIGAAEAALSATAQTQDSLRKQLGSVLERLDHTNLVLLALWELVGERLGLTVEQLRAKVAEIDLRDGVQDGRYSGSAGRCGGCNREIPPWRQRCLYCGQTRGGPGLNEVIPSPGAPK